MLQSFVHKTHVSIIHLNKRLIAKAEIFYSRVILYIILFASSDLIHATDTSISHQNISAHIQLLSQYFQNSFQQRIFFVCQSFRGISDNVLSDISLWKSYWCAWAMILESYHCHFRWMHIPRVMYSISMEIIIVVVMTMCTDRRSVVNARPNQSSVLIKVRLCFCTSRYKRILSYPAMRWEVDDFRLETRLSPN